MKISNILQWVITAITVVSAADTASWQSRNIYFVLTDRIARSATDGGGGSCGNLGNYCGGTFKGLEGKLDYIRGMGFNAVWITPIVASMSDIFLVRTRILAHTERHPRWIPWLLGQRLVQR